MENNRNTEIAFYFKPHKILDLTGSQRDAITVLRNGKCIAQDIKTLIFLMLEFKLKVAPRLKKRVNEYLEQLHEKAETNLVINKDAATYAEYSNQDLLKALTETEVLALKKYVNNKQEYRKQIIKCVQNKFAGFMHFKKFIERKYQEY